MFTSRSPGHGDRGSTLPGHAQVTARLLGRRRSRGRAWRGSRVCADRRLRRLVRAPIALGHRLARRVALPVHDRPHRVRHPRGRRRRCCTSTARAPIRTAKSPCAGSRPDRAMTATNTRRRSQARANTAPTCATCPPATTAAPAPRWAISSKAGAKTSPSASRPSRETRATRLVEAAPLRPPYCLASRPRARDRQSRRRVSGPACATAPAPAGRAPGLPARRYCAGCTQRRTSIRCSRRAARSVAPAPGS